MYEKTILKRKSNIFLGGGTATRPQLLRVSTLLSFKNQTVVATRTIRYDTIEEINVDSKAEYTA